MASTGDGVVVVVVVVAGVVVAGAVVVAVERGVSFPPAGAAGFKTESEAGVLSAGGGPVLRGERSEGSVA